MTAGTARPTLLRAPSQAWLVVGLLWITYLLNYLDRQVVFAMFPALKQDLHFTDAQLGLVGSVFLWVYAAAMAGSGRLADLVRREKIIAVSLLLWSLTILASSFSQSPGGLLAWRGLLAVTQALYIPAGVGLIATLHASHTRSRALAIHSTAQLTGTALSGWYGGWMADHWGWRTALQGLGIAGVLYCAVLWPALRRMPDSVPRRRSGAATPADIFRSPCYLSHTAAFFVFCIILWMLYAWLPTFIYEKFRLSMTESGFTATVYLQVSSAVGVLVGGALADWLVRRVPASRWYVSGAGMLLCAPFAHFTLAVSDLGWLKLCAAAFGFFSGLMICNNFASIYDVVAERNYGFAAGTVNVIGGLAAGSATYLAGLWKQSIGIGVMMQWAAVATAVAALVQIVTAAKSFDRERERLAQ